MKTKYRVGPREVAGVEPGGVLELGEDTDLNVPALVEAGHLTPLREGKTKAVPHPREGDG